MVATKSLGSQGFVGSEQGLGCMSLSTGSFYARPEGYTDEDAIAVLKRAFELGITLLNSADFYGNNEDIIGRAIKGLPREKVVITDKWGPTLKDGQFGYNIDARERIDASLSKLGVDALDLWVLRGSQGQAGGASIEDAMTAMKEQVDAGKVKYIGLSEVSIENVRKAHKIHPITAVELEWSLFSRECEEDLVPLCRELGIGILAYAPLGRGMLSGKPVKAEDLPAGDFRKNEERFSKENYDKNVELAQKVRALADRKGCTAGQLGLAWVQNQGPDVIPIPGTRNIKYLEENVKALGVKLTADEMRELEAAVPHSEVGGGRYPQGHGMTYRG